MYTSNFDSDSRLKTHRVGSDTCTLIYDAAGNPSSDDATTFTWSAAGKLLLSMIKNAKTHTYRYNALDQRISKNGPLSSKFFFFYDPEGN